MNRKGFTLIEVLIVVVIIAILAALILPRFLGQSERAYIAEAQQMLGAMKRGQQNYMDSVGASTGQTVATCGATQAACNSSEWRIIGMTMPSDQSSYNYACTTTTCTATRSSTNTYNGATITLSYAGATPNVFTCDGTKYSLLSSKTGCTA